MQNAGIIESKISHHLPVFCFLNYHNPSDDEVITKCPRYDYCETNMNNFISKLNTSLSEQFSIYNEATFIKFIEQFKKYSDECFKNVEEHCFKKSRRNYYVNPWVVVYKPPLQNNLKFRGRNCWVYYGMGIKFCDILRFDFFPVVRADDGNHSVFESF